MRDFRDAKAMAQTLRASLTAKTVTISHSESLELVSKMFGVADWNTLSAQIQAGREGPLVAAATHATEATHRRRHIPRALGRRTPALAIRAACGDWGRYDRLARRRCGCAAVAEYGWRPQRGLRLVSFRNRRSDRCCYDGGNDLSRATAPPGLRGAEPPHHVLSAGDGAHLRRPAGPDAAWRRAVATAAEVCFEWPTGGGLMRVA
jgi:hypothetical protein